VSHEEQWAKDAEAIAKAWLETEDGQKWLGQKLIVARNQGYDEGVADTHEQYGDDGGEG
jgi:hypothetical protein